jgi:hypothetical protein
MARKYNYIFSKLVKDKSDIQGHIAYAIYKFEKVSHIEEFKKKNGREPNEDEINAFHDSCCNPARLEEYNAHAERIIETFSNELLKGVADQIEEDYIKNQDNHLKKVLKSVLPSTGSQYFHGIIQSILAAILLSVFIWIAVAIVNKYNIGDIHITVGKQDTTMQDATAPTNDSITAGKNAYIIPGKSPNLENRDSIPQK